MRLNPFQLRVVRRVTRSVLPHGRSSQRTPGVPVRLSTFVQGFSIAVLGTAAAAVPSYGQANLATRVSRSADGVVHVQFASRPGTCGDGRDAIGFRRAFFAESFQSIGSWNAPTCVAGPVRVALTVAGKQVIRIKTFVSGSWPPTNERATDLGTVPAADAASYFFALVARLERT